MGKKKKKNRLKDKGQESGQDSKSGHGGAVKKKGKFPIIPVIIVVIAIAAFGVFALTNSKADSAGTKLTMADMAALKGGETKPTLNPALFRGQTAVSYSAANSIRTVLDYLYCYCNCKQSIGHKSLLSCFTDNHAANCKICQDQAMYAKNLNDKGYDIPSIRELVDKKFWRPLR